MRGEQRKQVAEQRQADYEAWYRHEYANWLRDEITDQSERLSAPMANTFHYTLTPDGLETDGGDPLLPVFADGYQNALAKAAQDDDWRFEAARRGIELDELNAMTAFARGGIHATALVVLSPCPDAVTQRGINIGAYDAARQKMLARIITQRTDGLPGITVSSVSLDGSDYTAMQAVAAALGHRLPEGLGSEDILARRLWVTAPIAGHQNLVDAIRDTYDQSLVAQFGGNWYAGRQGVNFADAKAFILQHPNLIAAHMAIVNRVKLATSDKAERNRLLNPHRYNLAAAFDDLLNGKQVTSLTEAGDGARAEGKEFNGDCPTDRMAATATEQAGLLGYGTKVEGNCPHCHTKVMFDPCNPECTACGATANHGSRRKIGAQAVRHALRPAKLEQRVGDQKRTRPGIEVRHRVIFGGTEQYFVDTRTGQRVDRPS